MTDLKGEVAAANSGASIEISKTPETIQVPNPSQRPRHHLLNLEYQLGLIKRKEEALKLRTAQVTKEQKDKVAELTAQIVGRLDEEDVIRTKEEQARKQRMDEIERLKANLDHCHREERVRQSKEAMVQELFEEDAECMKAELGARIKRWKTGQRVDAVSEDASAGHGTPKKRKASFDDIAEPRAKKACVLVPSSLLETESDAESYDSHTVGSSTQSQASVSSLCAASNPTTPERPRARPKLSALREETASMCGKEWQKHSL